MLCYHVVDKRTLLPYENNLPVFKRLLVQEPQHSRFMKLVADAPTTTLQRLKGITTGSLPTFIDIGSNFATAEINEDNIIDQVSVHRLESGEPIIIFYPFQNIQHEYIYAVSTSDQKK